MEENTEKYISFEGGFWKYFWRVVKKSKWLIFMGLFTSLMWLATAIFTNTLNLPELTYFNVMVSIMTFCDILTFATAHAFIVFISRKKDRYQQALNLCGIVNMVCVLVIGLVLFLAKDVILIDMFKLTDVSNSLFYYLMVGFIIIRCITRYYETVFRGTDLSKQLMIATFITFLALMSGWAILVLAGGMALNYIPIIFYVSQLISFGYVAYVHKRKNNINIFNIFKLDKPTKDEFLMIISKVLFEFIWQISYTICQMFILKVSETTYDCYMYFENVLDMFNMIYFAFMYVTSLEVATAIGEEKPELAYKISKYSVYISMWTWLIYFVLTGALCYPILLGMNAELFDVGLKTYFIYVGLHFFRFIIWCIASYCISMSGRNLAQIIIQVFSVSYYLTLFLTAQYLPDNEFAIYGFLIFEALVLAAVQLVLFFRKKWLTPRLKTTKKQE